MSTTTSVLGQTLQSPGDNIDITGINNDLQILETAIVSGDVKSVSAVGNVVTFTRTDGSTITLTLPLASESKAGLVQMASVAEAIAGTDTTKAVTAAGVKAAINRLSEGIAL